MINLTQQEADRFAAWLVQEAKSYDALNKQLAGDPIGQMIVKRNKQFQVACMIVADRLQRTERMVIGGDDQ